MSTPESNMTPQQEQVYKRHHKDLRRMYAFVEKGWPTAAVNREKVDMGSMVTLAMSTSLRSSVLLLAVGLNSKFTHNTFSKNKLHPWIISQDAKENRDLARHITEEWQKMVVPNLNGLRQRVDTIAKHMVFDFTDYKKFPKMIPLECDKKANVCVHIEDLEIWSHPRRDEPLQRVLKETKRFTQDWGYFVKIYLKDIIRDFIKKDQIKDEEERLIAARKKCAEKLDEFYSKYYCKLEAEGLIPTSYGFPTLQLALKTDVGLPKKSSQRYGDTFSGCFSAKDNEVHQKFPVDGKLQKWPLPTKENVFEELMKCAEDWYKTLVEEEGLPKNPNLELAAWRFTLNNPEGKDKEVAKKKLFKAIKENDMAPLYEEVCAELKWPIDKALLAKMQSKNQKNLEKLDETLKDTEENLGETEVRDALYDKAEYLCKIGDKEKALTVFRLAYDKAVALGYKLDIVFYQIRIGLFYLDNDLITRNIDKAKTLIEEGGDWDRRNRLKVYQGLYYLSIRDFKSAAINFLDSISTFTSYELMDYKTFVTYTVLASMIALERVDLRTKVVNGAEILEVLHQLPTASQFLLSFYNCHYSEFFVALAKVEGILKQDRLLAPHCRYYVREMRIHAYTQLLESYRSLTLQYMANAFGVSEEFIDKELSRFISAGRLNCKIDKVGGVVETNRPDHKNWQYQATIKQGDLLLNRIQKLSRVINV